MLESFAFDLLKLYQSVNAEPYEVRMVPMEDKNGKKSVRRVVKKLPHHWDRRQCATKAIELFAYAKDLTGIKAKAPTDPKRALSEIRFLINHLSPRQQETIFAIVPQLR